MGSSQPTHLTLLTSYKPALTRNTQSVYWSKKHTFGELWDAHKHDNKHRDSGITPNVLALLTCAPTKPVKSSWSTMDDTTYTHTEREREERYQLTLVSLHNPLLVSTLSQPSIK